MDYVVFGCLFEKKVDVLKELLVIYGSVVMVGDGINDVLVFVYVVVGIVMGEGMDIVMEIVDVVLMKNDLEKILYVYNFFEWFYWIIW